MVPLTREWRDERNEARRVRDARERELWNTAAELVDDQHPRLWSFLRTRKIKKQVLQLKIDALGVKPFKLPWYRKPSVVGKSLVTGLFLSVFAFGLYDVLFETGVHLGPLSMGLMAAGVFIAVAVLIATIVTAIQGGTISTGKKTWRMVVPGIFVGIAIAGIGAWIYRYHVANPSIIDNTAMWHALQPVAFIRHGWRKLGEGVLITAGAFSYGFNQYGKRQLKRLARGPHWWDYLEMFLRIPNIFDDEYRAKRKLPQLSGWQMMMTLLVWQFVYAGVIVWAGLYLVHRFQDYTINNPGPSGLQFFLEPLTGPAAYLVIGLFAGRTARRPIAPVITELQKWRAQTFVARDRKLNQVHHWLLSPFYVEVIHQLQVKGVARARQALKDRSRAQVFVMSAAAVVFFLIWVYGLYNKIKYGTS